MNKYMFLAGEYAFISSYKGDLYVLVPSNRKVLQIMLIGINIMHEEFVRSRDRKTI